MALVEFALLLPFLAMLVFATVDVGRVYALQSRLKNASREGAAWAQLRPEEVTCSNGIVERLKREDSIGTADGFAVTVTNATNGTVLTGCPAAGAPAAGQQLKVQVQANFKPVTFFITAITGDPIVVKGATEVEVQGQ